MVGPAAGASVGAHASVLEALDDAVLQLLHLLRFLQPVPLCGVRKSHFTHTYETVYKSCRANGGQ